MLLLAGDRRGGPAVDLLEQIVLLLAHHRVLRGVFPARLRQKVITACLAPSLGHILQRLGIDADSHIVNDLLTCVCCDRSTTWHIKLADR